MLLMLEVKKDDREIYSIMLKGLNREYVSVRENMVIHFPRNKEMVERYVCNRWRSVRCFFEEKCNSRVCNR